MKNSIIFIVGTSRKDGNTWALLDNINKEFSYETIDLSSLEMSYFDYNNKNISDDFIPTIEKILKYNSIGFVSPVYWYTISAQMKTFIDRLSDLIIVRKDLGRKLKGKSTFLIATGSTDTELPLGMEQTIELTSNYFNMNYQGSFYAKVKEETRFNPEILSSACTFVKKLAEI